jgi:uncharacterized Fe-S cluster-containing radical SAM superfamily protein
MNKLFLKYAEFYITNVCNLTCQGCNRFNSFPLKGYQSWHEHAETYKQWSQELSLQSIGIMGGEPFLNPEFKQWVAGLRELWPSTILIIATNGTQLSKHHDFYQTLLNDRKIELRISLHNKMHKQTMTKIVEDFLQEPFEYEFDNVKYRESLIITDSNGVKIKIMYNWWFHQGAIKTDPETGKHTLHDSDPEQAHKICHSMDCHHFENGRLYKCGPAALFPTFDQQIGLELTPEQRKIMEAVPYIDINHNTEQKQKFINNILNPIDQCRFCPSKYIGDQIFAQEKKIKVFI